MYGAYQPISNIQMLYTTYSQNVYFHKIKQNVGKNLCVFTSYCISSIVLRLNPWHVSKLGSLSLQHFSPAFRIRGLRVKARGLGQGCTKPAGRNPGRPSPRAAGIYRKYSTGDLKLL